MEQALWSDEVAEAPLSSTRQFINTFFLVDGGLEGAVLSRLPYDRVSINGTSPSTFAANDVVREGEREDPRTLSRVPTHFKGRVAFLAAPEIFNSVCAYFVFPSMRRSEYQMAKASGVGFDFRSFFIPMEVILSTSLIPGL